MSTINEWVPTIENQSKYALESKKIKNQLREMEYVQIIGGVNVNHS